MRASLIHCLYKISESVKVLHMQEFLHVTLNFARNPALLTYILIERHFGDMFFRPVRPDFSIVKSEFIFGQLKTRKSRLLFA